MVRIPRSFKCLDVPLPPMLLELTGVGKEHRFVALYNWYGKATWSNGETCTPFPVCTVWQPYVQHEAIAYQLIGYDFGSEKEEPSHALICDRLSEKVYVAAFELAIYFLNSQQEQTRPISVCQWQALKNKALAYTPATFEQMQKVGMLEMFLPPTPEHLQQAREMVMWLDKYV